MFLESRGYVDQQNFIGFKKVMVEVGLAEGLILQRLANLATKYMLANMLQHAVGLLGIYFPGHPLMSLVRLTIHCESGEGLWLQGLAASQVHSFRDAEPHPVIQQNVKKNYAIIQMQLRPGISTSLSTTDLCLLSAAWQ